MLLPIVVITGMRQRQYDIKNKKGVIGIVYSLFLLTVVLILTAAITESKPASAISPIGVSAGTGAGGAGGGGTISPNSTGAKSAFAILYPE